MLNAVCWHCFIIMLSSSCRFVIVLLSLLQVVKVTASHEHGLRAMGLVEKGEVDIHPGFGPRPDSPFNFFQVHPYACIDCESVLALCDN